MHIDHDPERIVRYMLLFGLVRIVRAVCQPDRQQKPIMHVCVCAGYICTHGPLWLIDETHAR